MPSKFVRIKQLDNFASVFGENKTEKDVSFIFEVKQRVQGKVSEILECFKQPNAINNLSLDFTNHRFETTDIVALANFLQSENCPESIEIILTSTELDIQSLTILSQVIASSCKAKSVSLNLANNRLGNECIHALSNLLSSASAPEKLYLNLASNRITDDGIGELSEYVKCQTSNIKDLAVNLLFNKTSESGSLILAQMLGSITEKENFKINYEFGKHGIKIISSLADALVSKTSPTALSLHFGVQHFSPEEIEIIFTALTQISVPQQIELDLSEQGLGDEGFISILNKLNNINSDLSLKIYLIFNSIRHNGARALEQFIRKNTITSNLLLDVSQNAFGGDDGKDLIIQAIKEAPEIFAHLRLVGPTREITALSESKKDEILAITLNHGLR
jgi:hypothetical protein